jgi:putative ABC transport system substrate-binding protein
MRRREFISLLGGATVILPRAVFAQQPERVFRIGFLGAASASGYASRVEAFRAGLRDFGYVEGENIIIEFRWAEGKYDRLPDLANELVRLPVDVLVTHGTPGGLAAKRATATIPIVVAVTGDAIATGLVPSLARPGGNITGSSFLSPELTAKRLELLKETITVAEVAVLINPDNPSTKPNLQAIQNLANSMKLSLRKFEARGPSEFDSIFSAIVKNRVDAIAVDEDAVFITNDKSLAELAARNRIPSTGNKEFAEAGGLIGYGVDFVEMFRRAAYFVDKILKGVKPASLPVELPTKFELVLNLKTAKELGIIIPPSIMVRADEVIE